MIRVLVCGAGGSPAVNFTRSLRKSREYYFVGVDCDPYYLERAEVDAKYLVPKAGEAEYVSVLNKIIIKEKIDFVHAQNDVEISVLSDRRHDLYAPLFLPSKETVKVCQDKLSTYKLWEGVGLPQPKTVQINHPDELKQALSDFGGKLWIRDTTGAGGRGSIAVRDFDTGKLWMDFKKGWGQYTAAELLSERSVTWQSIWKNGKLIVAQGRERLYWELSKISPSGVTGATGAGKTISDPLTDATAIAAVLAVDKEPHGIFSVDMTYDFNGVPNPTEINIGRFFTTHQFFTELGLNMPEIFVRLAMNEDYSDLVSKKVNPLPNDYIWIRGMDFEPVLTTTRALDNHKKLLLEMMNNG